MSNVSIATTVSSVASAVSSVASAVASIASAVAAVASTTTSTNANIKEENTMSNSVASTSIASTDSAIDQLRKNIDAADKNLIVIYQLRKLERLSDEMMNILEASIARTNSESIKDDAERYACLVKEAVAAFTRLPEEYRIKAHLVTDRWMGANLDAKDNEMLSSYIKVGRTLFSDLLAEAMNKQYQLLGY